MAGNTLGARAYYKYSSDTDKDYTILTDETLGDAAGLVKDASNPPPPRRFRPRGVYIEATIAGKKVRKFLVVQSDSTLYSDGSQDVLIDTVVFKTKGRRGERFSFGANP